MHTAGCQQLVHKQQDLFSQTKISTVQNTNFYLLVRISLPLTVIKYNNRKIYPCEVQGKGGDKENGILQLSQNIICTIPIKKSMACVFHVVHTHGKGSRDLKFI